MHFYNCYCSLVSGERVVAFSAGELILAFNVYGGRIRSHIAVRPAQIMRMMRKKIFTSVM